MMPAWTFKRVDVARDVIWMGSTRMKKFRWSDWLAAAAIVVALGAFAGAEAGEDAPVVVADMR